MHKYFYFSSLILMASYSSYKVPTCDLLICFCCSLNRKQWLRFSHASARSVSAWPLPALWPTLRSTTLTAAIEPSSSTEFPVSAKASSEKEPTSWFPGFRNLSFSTSGPGQRTCPAWPAPRICRMSTSHLGSYSDRGNNYFIILLFTQKQMA